MTSSTLPMLALLVLRSSIWVRVVSMFACRRLIARTVFSTRTLVESICALELEAPRDAAEALEAISWAAAPSSSMAAATVVV